MSARHESIPGGADVFVGKTHPSSEPDEVPHEAETSVRWKHWYSRGYLPHIDSPNQLQAITFRLCDSLPRVTLDSLEAELRVLPRHRRNTARRQRIDAWLDAGMGCCVLRHPQVASHVQDAFHHFHGIRYHLHAWCVMPNHVHVLIEPLVGIAATVQGWKSVTARWILRNAKPLGLSVPEGKALWLRDYWDRYIRDENHYRSVVDYIHRNPVKAGLCPAPQDWPWSSAWSADARCANHGSANPGSADVLVGKASQVGDHAKGHGKPR